LLKRLSADLGRRFQSGFGVDNLHRFGSFYLTHPPQQIYATVSRKSSGEKPTKKYATLLRKSLVPSLPAMAACFPLPWLAYVRLLSVKNEHTRKFYEEKALRGGWSVRQLANR